MELVERPNQRMRFRLRFGDHLQLCGDGLACGHECAFLYSLRAGTRWEGRPEFSLLPPGTGEVTRTNPERTAEEKTAPEDRRRLGNQRKTRVYAASCCLPRRRITPAMAAIPLPKSNMLAGSGTTVMNSCT